MAAGARGSTGQAGGPKQSDRKGRKGGLGIDDDDDDDQNEGRRRLNQVQLRGGEEDYDEAAKNPTFFQDWRQSEKDPDNEAQ